MEKYRNDIVNTVMELVKFKSISEKTKDTKAPFGEECKKALEYILKLGKSFGFRTKNIDGYCGYIEFGEGEELVRNNWSFRCCSCKYGRWLDI